MRNAAVIGCLCEQGHVRSRDSRAGKAGVCVTDGSACCVRGKRRSGCATRTHDAAHGTESSTSQQSGPHVLGTNSETVWYQARSRAMASHATTERLSCQTCCANAPLSAMFTPCVPCAPCVCRAGRRTRPVRGVLWYWRQERARSAGHSQARARDACDRVACQAMAEPDVRVHSRRSTREVDARRRSPKQGRSRDSRRAPAYRSPAPPGVRQQHAPSRWTTPVLKHWPCTR